MPLNKIDKAIAWVRVRYLAAQHRMSYTDMVLFLADQFYRLASDELTKDECMSLGRKVIWDNTEEIKVYFKYPITSPAKEGILLEDYGDGRYHIKTDEGEIFAPVSHFMSETQFNAPPPPPPEPTTRVFLTLAELDKLIDIVKDVDTDLYDKLLEEKRYGEEYYE